MQDLKRQVLFHLVMLWRRRWLALGIAWPICLAGWVFIAMLPSKYLATARIYVDTETLLAPLLKGIAANPAERVSQLPLLGPSERQRVLIEWNNTQAAFPQDKTLHQYFEAQAEQRQIMVSIDAPLSVPAAVDQEKLERVFFNLFSKIPNNKIYFFNFFTGNYCNIFNETLHNQRARGICQLRLPSCQPAERTL